MVNVTIPCNVYACVNEVEEHFYCEHCFFEKLEKAREDERERAKHQAK